MRLPRPAVGGLGLVLVAAVATLVVPLGGAQPAPTARVSGIRGSAQLRRAGARGELIVRGLTPPPEGDVYEVWLEPTHSPPLPTQLLFTVGSADLQLPGNLDGISRVLVTPEPAGGSLAPSHTPVIVASLS